MATYKTPGVYVEEISTLPPSVAEVATAIPAFIGYTQVGKQVKRISTLLEYEAEFGGAKPSAFTVTVNADKQITAIQRDTPTAEYLMYDSLRLYFRNGGGSCYIVSIGSYDKVPEKADFEAGLLELEKEDEPTLIVLTDAVNLAEVDYYALGQAALGQCNKLGDRFTILDVVKGKVGEFRQGIGINYLMYGAAYHPYLHTALTYTYQEELVKIVGLAGDAPTAWRTAFGENGIVIEYNGAAGDNPHVEIIEGADEALVFAIDESHTLRIENVAGKTGANVVAAWENWVDDHDAQGFTIALNGDGSDNVAPIAVTPLDPVLAGGVTTLADIKTSETALYNQIKAALNQVRIVLPPSAAIAGIYASVDRDRGVWKAPANVSVNAVIGPVIKITHEQQENLNVDTTAGKSINALRAFTGKGTLVWGARTLAGNDNEWRYVSVRRLFNMIEESTQKATAFAVFEPNDTTTWLKVKAMIDSYLYGLWQQGALAGPTSEAAYFVNVGLGKTMTAQDILEGRMVVEIGIAAVRPAEFIILRFTHKMQEA